MRNSAPKLVCSVPIMRAVVDMAEAAVEIEAVDATEAGNAIKHFFLEKTGLVVSVFERRPAKNGLRFIVD